MSDDFIPNPHETRARALADSRYGPGTYDRKFAKRKHWLDLTAGVPFGEALAKARAPRLFLGEQGYIHDEALVSSASEVVTEAVVRLDGCAVDVVWHELHDGIVVGAQLVATSETLNYSPGDVVATMTFPRPFMLKPGDTLRFTPLTLGLPAVAAEWVLLESKREAIEPNSDAEDDPLAKVVEDGWSDFRRLADEAVAHAQEQLAALDQLGELGNHCDEKTQNEAKQAAEEGLNKEQFDNLVRMGVFESPPPTFLMDVSPPTAPPSWLPLARHVVYALVWFLIGLAVGPSLL